MRSQLNTVVNFDFKPSSRLCKNYFKLSYFQNRDNGFYRKKVHFTSEIAELYHFTYLF